MELPTYEELLRQLKFNFWLLGIPFGDNKIYIRYYILLILINLMLAEEIAFFLSRISPENFLELTRLTPCACIGFLSILKILAITTKRRKIFELTEHLGRLYKIISDDKDKAKVIEKELFVVKFLSKYFFVLNLILISVYNFSTIVFMCYYYMTKNKLVYMLPYAVLLPFSTESWLPWFIVYIHSILCGFICVLYYTTVDVLYCILTSHVCNNFAIISDRLQRLSATNVDILKEIVRDHQYILKLTDYLEDIFTAPNLFNVVVGSIEICALGFNLMTGDLTQLPGSILFLSSVLLQILMMSVFGENIITESRKIGEAAFLCNWYEMDEKCKKIIITILIRCQRPQKLTAYKFSVISYGSFSKIISTSWSYFTILRTVYTQPTADKE